MADRNDAWALIGDGALSVSLDDTEGLGQLIVAGFATQPGLLLGSRPDLPAVGWAGTAGTVLPYDIHIDIDLAEPEVVRLLAFDMPLPALHDPRGLRWWPLLEAFVGPDRAEGVLSAAAASLASRRVEHLGPIGRTLVDRDLARFLLASCTADDPDVRGLAVLVARVEAAAAAVALRGFVVDVAERARVALAGLAEPLLRGPLEDIPELPDRKDAFELAALVRVAAQASPTLAGLASDLSEALHASAGPVEGVPSGAADFARSPVAGAAVTTPSPLSAAKVGPVDVALDAVVSRSLRIVQPVPVDGSRLPGLLASAAGAVRRTDAEVELVVDGGARACAGWWARASGPDGTPLAVAPMRPGGLDALDAVARLLCPPAALSTGVVIDCTPSLALLPRSAGARAVEEAITVGRAASRAWRGSHPSARRLLGSCGDLWEQAGVSANAEAARRVANDVQRVVGPRLLSDRLAADEADL